ncbi:MAG TPA: serine/threonine-protein kinase [Candidatus Thermoplasmatota archaeon]|nr:serine/threonine-protein kinase [Candidatus Thermoplasmatota archaeon]
MLLGLLAILAAGSAAAGARLDPEIVDRVGDAQGPGSVYWVTSRPDPAMDIFFAYFANDTSGDVVVTMETSRAEGNLPPSHYWIVTWEQGNERFAVWYSSKHDVFQYGRVGTSGLSLSLDARTLISFAPLAVVSGEVELGDTTVVRLVLPRAVAQFSEGLILARSAAHTADCDEAGDCRIADTAPNGGYGRAFVVAQAEDPSLPPPEIDLSGESSEPLQTAGVPDRRADPGLLFDGNLFLPLAAAAVALSAGGAALLRRRVKSRPPAPAVDASARVALDPGLVAFGRYLVKRSLSSGGFGRIVLAEDQLLARPVVVKELLPEWRRDAAAKQALLHEARAAGSLAHPHIVTVYDIARAGDDHYLVMEYVGGGSLEERLKKQGTLPLTETLRMAAEILSALSAVHARGIIHRDIKPANVLLSQDGSVKLTDFGVAQTNNDDLELTTTNRHAGTVAYMPPEQILGDPVDGRSDLYALGALMVRMLTGRRYLPGTTTEEFRRNVLDKEPLLPIESVPDDVNALLRKALSKKKEQRFQTAAEMRAAVLAALRRLPEDASSR